MKKLLSVVLCVIISFGCFSAFAAAEEACVHEYTSVTVSPTCAQQGYTIHTCSKCGNYYYTDIMPTVPHYYGSWYSVDVATCIAEGHEQRDCINCESSEIRTIPIVAHIDADKNGYCDVCNFDMIEDDNDDKNTVSPFEWLKAFFKAVADWFRAIFA